MALFLWLKNILKNKNKKTKKGKKERAESTWQKLNRKNKSNYEKLLCSTFYLKNQSVIKKRKT
ncbi:hypothetical protein ACJJIL_05150 [Microbulbifer sp. EKSA005]|uniref:hypothetical protein n=1 Tax=Microbulbifer sp. EKSA005 TaxID=3243364 RepID=UPI0040414690